MLKIKKTPRKTFHCSRIAKELRLMCWRFVYGYLHLSSWQIFVQFKVMNKWQKSFLSFFLFVYMCVCVCIAYNKKDIQKIKSMGNLCMPIEQFTTFLHQNHIYKIKAITISIYTKMIKKKETKDTIQDVKRRKWIKHNLLEYKLDYSHLKHLQKINVQILFQDRYIIIEI